MKKRTIETDLLDILPHDDPAALRAREEMLQINGIMGNHRWVERMVRRHREEGWRVTELGAGDGALCLRLLEAGCCAAEDLHAFDLAPRPKHWPVRAHWARGNVLEQALPDTEIVIANLFLHHFTQEQLGVLGARLSPVTRLIVAVEPARRWIYSVLGRLFCEVAELNHVQRHDMQTSIRAGFRGRELQGALGLGREWEVSASEHPLGGCRLMAWRREEREREEHDARCSQARPHSYCGA
ncbi:hypothetical protein [Prosthecobacter sp.]|uniref:hypothetical protein n=1 Tax=Prosthecobacter sp. TaxID=1965333 RepID=UPI003783E6C6